MTASNDITTSTIIEQQLAHASVRAFEDLPVDNARLEQIVAAGQAAASSSFIQAYSVVRVTRPEAREAIAAAAGGQKWVVSAPEFLVWCADLSRINLASEQADKGTLEGYTEHSIAAIVDVTLAAQNAFLAAESLGLGGVYIGGIRNNPQVVIDQLKLPQRVFPVFGMCLGWPIKPAEVKPRMPVSAILHTDEYQTFTTEDLAAYDQTMASYYASRSSNTKLSDWGSAASQAVQGKTREHMLEVLQQQGFFRR